MIIINSFYPTSNFLWPVINNINFSLSSCVKDRITSTKSFINWVSFEYLFITFNHINSTLVRNELNLKGMIYSIPYSHHKSKVIILYLKISLNTLFVILYLNLFIILLLFSSYHFLLTQLQVEFLHLSSLEYILITIMGNILLLNH